MEFVAAASSIAGLLSLTIQALEMIDRIKVFSSQFDSRDTTVFLRDVSTSAIILRDVKSLCGRLNGTRLALKNGFKLASLQLQVEECTNDLVACERLTEKFQPHKSRLMYSTMHKLFEMYLSAVTAQGRGRLRERFRRHQANMQVALSVLGREFDIQTVHGLEELNQSYNSLSSKLHDQCKEIRSQSEQLSSSSSSLYSMSQEHGSRLRQVEDSQNTIQKQLDRVTELILNLPLNVGNMQVLSQELGIKPNQPVPEGQTHGLSRNRWPKDEKGIRKHPKTYFPKRLVKDETHELFNGCNNDLFSCQCQVHRLPPLNCQRLEAYNPAFMDFIHHSFQPGVADYIMTQYALAQLEFQQNFLEVWCGHVYDAKKSPQPQADERNLLESYLMETQYHLQLRSERSYLKQKLSNIRRTAISDGLGTGTEVVNHVDREFQVSRVPWKNSKFLHLLQETPKKSLGLEALTFRDEVERRRDRLTRLNQWLLDTMNISEDLRSLHRKILFAIVAETKHFESSQTLNEDETDEEAWGKLVMKSWFLDLAALTDEEYIATFSSVGGTEQSEATIIVEPWKRYYRNYDPEGDGDKQPAGLTTGEELLITPLERDYVHFMRKAVLAVQFDLSTLRRWADSPPEGANTEQVAEAMAVLDSYQLESSRNGCEWLRAEVITIMCSMTNDEDARRDYDYVWSFYCGWRLISVETQLSTDISDTICLGLVLKGLKDDLKAKAKILRPAHRRQLNPELGTTQPKMRQESVTTREEAKRRYHLFSDIMLSDIKGEGPIESVVRVLDKQALLHPMEQLSELNQQALLNSKKQPLFGLSKIGSGV